MAVKKKKSTHKTSVKKRKKKVVTYIVKKAEFDLYLFWRLIPLSIRREKTLAKRRAMAVSFGLEDPVAIELAEIKTQGEFAKRYGVRESTLSEWNKKVLETDMYKVSQAFYMKLVHKVDEALVEGATRQSKSSPSDRKLFYQRMHGFAEKTDNKHEVSGIADMLRDKHNRKRKNGSSKSKRTK